MPRMRFSLPTVATMSLLRPRRPPASTLLHPHRCLAAAQRHFTTSRAQQGTSPDHERRAEKRNMQQIWKESARSQREQSMRVRIKEMMNSPEMPDDFGLLPGTIILPTGANRLSFFKWPLVRVKIAWARLKQAARDRFYTLTAKWFIVKPRPKLRTRRVPNIAKALHCQMYTALAEGDEAALTNTCAAGLTESMTSRVRRRPRGERWTWTLHRYRGWPRIISHRCMAMPLGDSKYMTIRQAVVRIRSVQSLVKDKAGGTGPHAHGEKQAHNGAAAAAGQMAEQPRDLTEYIVVQQIFGATKKHEQWKVWGTIEEDKDVWKKYL